MSLTKALALFSLVLSASALATPHLYNGHHHRAVAARLAAPDPIPFPVAGESVIHRRSLGKRCRPRPPSSASVLGAIASPTPLNVGAQPTTSPIASTTTTAAEAPPPPPPLPLPLPLHRRRRRRRRPSLLAMHPAI